MVFVNTYSYFESLINTPLNRFTLALASQPASQPASSNDTFVRSVNSLVHPDGGLTTVFFGISEDQRKRLEELRRRKKNKRLDRQVRELGKKLTKEQKAGAFKLMGLMEETKKTS